MSNPNNVLAQATPAANTLTDLYTVPAVTSAALGLLMVCNTNNASIAFRVSIAVGGAADALKQYLYYDAVLGANLSNGAILGISLNTGDIVRVRSDTANVAFTLNVVENP